MLRSYKDKLIERFTQIQFILLESIFLFLIAFPLSGEEAYKAATPPESYKMSFLDLPSLSHEMNGKRVEIRGFIYRSPKGDYILSPTPNLKSCCVGAKHQAEKQIYLLGDFPPPILQRATTLRGILHLNNDQDGKVKSDKHYLLTEWSVTSDDRSSLPYLSLVIAVTFLFILWLLYKRSSFSKLLSHKTTNF